MRANRGSGSLIEQRSSHPADDRLDLLSNLFRTDDRKLLVSRSTGTVGRPITGPDGLPRPLEGFISEIDVRGLLAVN